MDLTLVPLSPNEATAPQSGGDCTAPQTGEAPDGSLAMGTTFDCFDAKANTAAPGLTEEERANRTTLVEAMQAQGFENYPQEWWHFTLEGEPYPDTIFDFPIEPRNK